MPWSQSWTVSCTHLAKAHLPQLTLPVARPGKLSTGKLLPVVWSLSSHVHSRIFRNGNKPTRVLQFSPKKKIQFSQLGKIQRDHACVCWWKWLKNTKSLGPPPFYHFSVPNCQQKPGQLEEWDGSQKSQQLLKPGWIWHKGRKLWETEKLLEKMDKQHQACHKPFATKNSDFVDQKQLKIVRELLLKNISPTVLEASHGG